MMENHPASKSLKSSKNSTFPPCLPPKYRIRLQTPTNIDSLIPTR
jgi:hypothetical protein